MSVFWCIQPECNHSPVNATANYMIIAVRNHVPTSAREESWGGVKREYLEGGKP